MGSRRVEGGKGIRPKNEFDLGLSRGYTVGLLRGKRSKSEPDLDLDLDQVGGVYSWFTKGKSRPQAEKNWISA